MAQAETLQGLHLMLVHNPEQAIRRVHGMQGQRPRWHKLIVHGEKADWLNRMPAGTSWDIRNVDISEEPLTDANAERLGREHAEVHARTLRNYVAAGIAPDRLAFEGRNEPLPDEFPYVARYEVARIGRAQELGVPRLILGNFSVGQPSTIGCRPDTATDWSPFDPIRAAMRPGDLLGLHQYYGVGGPWEAWGDGHLRWVAEGGRHLMCPWDVPIFISEGGIDDGVNGRPKIGWMGIPASGLDKAAQAYADMIAWADRQYLADGRIVGVVLFTHDFENREWNHFDMSQDPMWSVYERYLKEGVDATLWGDRRTARWQFVIQRWADKYDLPARVIATLVAVESGGNPHSQSYNGRYVGLLRLPCREAGFSAYPERAVLLHPDRNIERGAQLLAECRDAFPNWTAIINAYFVGLEAAKRGTWSVTNLSDFVKVWGELWPGVACPVRYAQDTTAAQPDAGVPTADVVRNVAWQSLYPVGGVPYAPAFAFPAKARALGLAQPLTREVRFAADGQIGSGGPYVLQGFDGAPGGILWCKYGDWTGIAALAWN